MARRPGRGSVGVGDSLPFTAHGGSLRNVARVFGQRPDRMWTKETERGGDAFDLGQKRLMNADATVLLFLWRQREKVRHGITQGEVSAYDAQTLARLKELDRLGPWDRHP